MKKKPSLKSVSNGSSSSLAAPTHDVHSWPVEMTEDWRTLSAAHSGAELEDDVGEEAGN